MLLAHPLASVRTIHILPRPRPVRAHGRLDRERRAARLPAAAPIEAAGRRVSHAPVFSAAQDASPIWYENSIGLAEIAVNRGSAAIELGVRVGDPVRF